MSASSVHVREVFADPAGRRRRRVRRAWWTLGVLALVAALVGVPYAFTSSAASGAWGRPTLHAKDVRPDLPIVGSGPLERVVRVAAGPDGVRATEPFTGEDLGVLPGVTAASVAGHEHAIQHYGYRPGAGKTIALTFDDGPDPAVTRALLDVLSREHVPATFFVVGRNAVRDPELVRRMVREGHAVGGHTLSHPDVAHEPNWREQKEVVGTARLIRAVTGTNPLLWRMPYTAADPVLERETIEGMLRAQRLGYVHASYDFDTLDWEHDADPNGKVEDIPLPDLTGDGPITMLLHDAGGPNRMRSVAYVQRLVTEARAHGYTFTTMPQVAPVAGEGAAIAPTLADRLVLGWAQVAMLWPSVLMRVLFWVAIVLTLGLGVFQVVCALVRRRRRASLAEPHPSELDVPTTVVLAAYNEEVVIARTLRSVLDSTHPVDEVIVVDDGSTDGTAAAVEDVARTDPRVRLVRQENAGKAAALNRGLALAQTDVVVTLDADTILTPRTVGALVRHFWLDDAAADRETEDRPGDTRRHRRSRAIPGRGGSATGEGRGRLGGVAGVVRVGNRTTNWITRWQALEYVTQIGLERASQDALHAISIVPGACAAWRREAVLDAGGYSTDTLAEDCDLALTLHRRGWRTTQDDDAIAYTEAPETVDDLLKQRARWTYGTLQATYKHRRALFRRGSGFLGWFVLPTYVLSILVPLVFLPFVYTMAVLSLQQEGPGILLTYFGLFLVGHLALATAAVALMRERWSHLLYVPLYRIVYEPLRAYLLYTSVHLALTGGRLDWQKLDRSGAALDDSLGATAVERPEPPAHTDSDLVGVQA